MAAPPHHPDGPTPQPPDHPDDPVGTAGGGDSGGAAQRLVLLHGFTQTGRCWEPASSMLRRALGASVEVVTPDLPGHGDAGARSADLWDCAGYLLEQLGIPAGQRQDHGAGSTAAPVPPTTWVGYSLGGRVALHVALLAPHAVDRLVLIGATPGLVDPDERAARRRADDELAQRLLRVGVPAFLDEWLANPLFAGLPAHATHREERARNDPAGLASSLRNAGTGTQEPLWERLGDLRCPTLLVTGEHDAKFTAIAEAMVPRLGAPVVHAVVGGCGHSVHLETPERFVDVLLTWWRAPAQTW